MRLGDWVHEEIDRRVIGPAEGSRIAMVREAAAGLKTCGGCRATQRDLNGGGALAGEGPETVV